MKPTWRKVGQSIYMLGDMDAFVWREKRKWFRTDLPCEAMRHALNSVAMSSLGMFSESTGPYKTMAEAKRGKKRL